MKLWSQPSQTGKEITSWQFVPSLFGQERRIESAGKAGREARQAHSSDSLLSSLWFYFLLWFLHFGVSSHVLKCCRFHSFGGEDYSNEVLSCNTGNITSCLEMKKKEESKVVCLNILEKKKDKKSPDPTVVDWLCLMSKLKFLSNDIKSIVKKLQRLQLRFFI